MISIARGGRSGARAGVDEALLGGGLLDAVSLGGGLLDAVSLGGGLLDAVSLGAAEDSGGGLDDVAVFAQRAA